jgi:hypothetical protein
MKRKLLGNRAINQPKDINDWLSKAIKHIQSVPSIDWEYRYKMAVLNAQLAVTYLEDGAPHSALRVLRDGLGYAGIKYACEHCRKTITDKQIGSKIGPEQYVCKKCIAAQIVKSR